MDYIVVVQDEVGRLHKNILPKNGVALLTKGQFEGMSVE
jgi:hypothetical protein